MWNRWNQVRTLAVSIFALAWWGILYPELCFAEETFDQVIEAEEFQGMTQPEIYEHLLKSSGDEIVIESRLLEWIQENVTGKGKS